MSGLLVVAGVFVMSAFPAQAFTLNGDQNLSVSTTLSGTSTESLAPVMGDGSRTNPLVYRWAGSGVSANLDLQGYKISTYTNSTISLVVDPNGGNITGSGTYAFDTYAYAFYGRSAGSVSLTNVGAVSIGAIRTVAEDVDVGTGVTPGDVTIGTPDVPAGIVRVNSIDTRMVGAGGSAGGVAVYGSGNVTIGTSGGTAGNILTSGGNRDGSSAGTITIIHYGAFSAGELRTSAWASYSYARDILLNGGGAGGACRIASVDSRNMNSSVYGKEAGPVTITGYGSVRITSQLMTSIDSAYNWDNTHPDGGNVNITNITGDIVLDCTNTCNGAAADLSRDGYMRLANTAGTISIGDVRTPGAHVLDLYQFKYLVFDNASRKSVIYDDINHFVEGESRLRVARNGDVVYYAFVPGGLNDDLLTGGNKGVYSVYSEQGGTGVLRPLPVKGTIVILR